MISAPHTIEVDAANSSAMPWAERNHTVLALGLAWLDALLAGEGGSGAARAACDSAREDMRRAGEPAQIDRLSVLFRLAPFDEDLLLFLLASQLNARPKQATPQLAQTLFAGLAPGAEAKVWERLGPRAPLRRFQLIECPERPLSALSPLAIDERVSRYIMGEDMPDIRLSTLVAPLNSGPCPKRHGQDIVTLAARLRFAMRPMAVILGPKRSGRRAAAAALAAALGLGAFELKPRGLEASPELLPVLRRETVLGGFALVVDISSPDGQRVLEERLAQFDTLVIAIAESRPELLFEIPFLRLDALDAADRAQLWRDALNPAPADFYMIDALAEQFKFGPREIAAAASEGGDPWQACRDRGGRELEALAERIVPHYGWEDIALPPDVLHDLKAAAAQVRQRSLVYGAHGFASKLTRGRGISVLLSGPSGTGKTMAAEVIARDLNLDLYRIDLSSVVSKYIGETEKNLRAVFDAAEASGAVLFFDEADALFGKRSEVKDSHDRYANIEVSYLLQRMENYSGLAILATNMKSRLDPAFMRRLRFVIDVPFPDAALRRQIWIKAFPPQMPKETLNYDMLARLDIAGGNIAVIAVNAAFLAAAEGVPLAIRHIARAARAEFRKLDKELRLNWFEGV